MVIQYIREISSVIFERLNVFTDWYVANSRVILDVINYIFEHIFTFLIFVAFFLMLFYCVISTYGFFSKKTKEKKFILQDAPEVTIQIPTYNELAALNCAKRCLEFDYPKNKYWIMIGDDSTDESISKKIDDFAKKHKNIIVTRRGINIGYKPGNLNHMLKYTKTPYIVVFDSDFLPNKDFLRRIMTPFIYDKNLSGVQARWKVNNSSQNMVTVLGSSIVNMCHYLLMPFMKKLSGTVNFCGSAEAVNVSLLRDLGEWKMGALTEDIEYTMRTFKAKRSILYIENLTCECEVPHTFRDLCKQQMRWAYGNISAFKEHFLSILFDSKISIGVKSALVSMSTGYLMTFLIVLLTFFGFVSFITHPPGPINLYMFFSDMFRNIALSSGLLIAGAFSIYFSKLSKLNFLKLLFVSFTSGLVVTYYVNVGMLEAIREKPMQWFMLKKNGNKC